MILSAQELKKFDIATLRSAVQFEALLITDFARILKRVEDYIDAKLGKNWQ